RRGRLDEEFGPRRQTAATRATDVPLGAGLGGLAAHRGALSSLLALLNRQLRDSELATESLQLLKIDAPHYIHDRELARFACDDNQTIGATLFHGHVDVDVLLVALVPHLYDVLPAGCRNLPAQRIDIALGVHEIRVEGITAHVDARESAYDLLRGGIVRT